MERFKELLEKYNFEIDFGKMLEVGGNLLLAIIILLVGLRIIKKVSSWIEIAMKRSGISDNIRPFLVSIISISFKIILFFVIAGLIGLELTSLVAVLAAAGFAVGMALQGSLGNFASGLIILLFKPYKVGDWVMVSDKFGKVEEIQIFNTIIETPGHKTLIVPNAQITDGIVTNFSRKGYIRLELNVSMPYEENFPRVKEIILDAIKDVPKILSKPAPEVGIETYDSHNIQLAVWPYAKPDDFWEVTFQAHEKIKSAFHDNNIKVAYSEGVEMGSIGG